MIVSIIAAIGENRELGKNNKLLWHIPEDFARFKKITSFHPVIMGRTTFESIGKPLPNRRNIIVTRNLNYSYSSRSDEHRTEKSSMLSSHQVKLGSNNKITIVHSLEEAIAIASKTKPFEIFIIGGGQIYEQGIKYADKLYLTVVKGKFDADTYFPEYKDFSKVVFQKKLHDQNHEYIFLDLIKE